MIGSLIDCISLMQSGKLNLTDNGKCTGCGECCSNYLPMNEQEIAIIKKHIKKHRIKPHNFQAPLARPTLDLTCPFLDKTKPNEKCTIYQVRPEICRQFVCSKTGVKDYMAANGTGLWDGSRKPVNVRKTFFS